MTPVILYRRLDNADENEVNAINANSFKLTESRLDIKSNELVIGRYSVLPYFGELEKDLNTIGAKLINTHKQHLYIANLRNWYEDLKEFTPRTWFSLEGCNYSGPFVLKGHTNSRKFQWDTHMYAQNLHDAAEIAVELSNDSLIGYQDIVYREYVPLKTYYKSIHGLPITKEFRFFVAYRAILSGGFYWSSHVENLKEQGFEIPNPEEVPKSLLVDIINKIGDSANFYTIDVAQTEDGKWILIELNDGQMAGLSENDPYTLYENLKRVVDRKHKLG